MKTTQQDMAKTVASKLEIALFICGFPRNAREQHRLLGALLSTIDWLVEKGVVLEDDAHPVIIDVPIFIKPTKEDEKPYELRVSLTLVLGDGSLITTTFTISNQGTTIQEVALQETTTQEATA